MKTMRIAACALLLAIGLPASGHRLDEYLQATTISVEKGRIHAEIRLTPGIAVYSRVMAAIDTNRDGVISAAEQRAYAEQVLRDLSLSVDGDRLSLHLLSWKYASTQDMKEGRGEIQIDFDASVPRTGHNRQLVFENHHQNKIAAYLVNCLVPTDPDIQVTGQNRNYLQSRYELSYVQAGASPAPAAFARKSVIPVRTAIAALLLFAPLALLWRTQTRISRRRAV